MFFGEGKNFWNHKMSKFNRYSQFVVILAIEKQAKRHAALHNSIADMSFLCSELHCNLTVEKKKSLANWTIHEAGLTSDKGHRSFFRLKH